MGDMSFLLRVVLPDRPGMLGAVATALGEAGADIVSLDVVERGPDGAVDDLLVQLPPGGLADVLITAAHSVPGVVVESLRPYLGADDLHRDLELVDELAAAPAEAMQLLVDLAPGVFRAGWAVLVTGQPRGRSSGDDGGVVVATSAGAPDLSAVQLEWLPLVAARRMDPSEAWVPERWQAVGTELAAAPVGASDRVILLGRPGGPRFRASEVARLAHLAGIAATVTSVHA